MCHFRPYLDIMWSCNICIYTRVSITVKQILSLLYSHNTPSVSFIPVPIIGRAIEEEVSNDFSDQSRCCSEGLPAPPVHCRLRYSAGGHLLIHHCGDEERGCWHLQVWTRILMMVEWLSKQAVQIGTGEFMATLVCISCRFHVKQPRLSTGLRVLYNPGPVRFHLDLIITVNINPHVWMSFFPNSTRVRPGGCWVAGWTTDSAVCQVCIPTRRGRDKKTHLPGYHHPDWDRYLLPASHCEYPSTNLRFSFYLGRKFSFS